MPINGYCYFTDIGKTRSRNGEQLNTSAVVLGGLPISVLWQ